MFVGLRGKTLDECRDFPVNVRFVERHKDIRPPEIAVIFRNLVAQHEMITKHLIRDFGNKPVVLMSVIGMVCQHEVR